MSIKLGIKVLQKELLSLGEELTHNEELIRLHNNPCSDYDTALNVVSKHKIVLLEQEIFSLVMCISKMEELVYEN